MSAASRRLWSIYALLAAVALACAPSTLSLARQWLNFDDPGYTHGFALAAVFFWLVFRARYDLAATPARPAPLAYLGLLACALAWLVFWRASLQTLHELMLPVLVGLAVCAALGWRVARRLTIPIALLYFALPAWDVLTPLLQFVTIHAVGGMLALAGVPTHIEGTLLYVPEGVFEVVAACSGLNFLVAGLALATLFGEIHRDSTRVRIALVAAMAALAVVTNWLRVFVIVFAGHLTDMQHSLVRHGHYTVGWAIFTVAAVIFITLASRLPAAPEPSGAIHKAAAHPAYFPAACISAALVLAVIPAGRWLAQRNGETAAQQLVLTLPPGKQNWRGPMPLVGSSWRPVFMGAQGVRQAFYEGPSELEIEALAVTYLAQRQGAELVGYENSLSGSQLFISQAASAASAAGSAFREITVIDAQGKPSLIWSVYLLGSRRFVTPVLFQLGYGLGSLAAPLRSGLIAFRASCKPSCDEARRSLERFVIDMGPEFERIQPGSASLLFFRGNLS